jgi:prepilin-type N-terminal cleavage/methylation domain-containing protein
LTNQRYKKLNNAFTLIELIIVVMIISMVGFLVFSEAVKQTKKPKNLSPLTLKDTLHKTIGNNQEAEFFCIEDCKSCYYIAKGAEIIPFKGNINLGKDLKIFKVDKNNQAEQIEELGRVKDKKICFRFHLYKNGSTEQMIISNNKGIYYLPTYFQEPKEVEDMDEAQELWIQSEYNLKDSGNFY